MIDFESSYHLFVDPKADESGINSQGETVRWPQIVLNNLPKHAQKHDITKYLNDMNIEMRKVKIIPRKPFCFVVFNTDDDMKNALKYIAENKLKNQKVPLQFPIK